MTTFLSGLQSLIQSDQPLPTLPVVVFELHRLLEEDHPSLQDVAALVQRDPVLAARMLRTVNTPPWAGGTEIRTVEEAVEVLGLSEIRAMSLVMAAVRAFDGEDHRLDHRRFWQHSTAVALVARWLSEGMPPADDAEEDPYAAGLLHDVGHLIVDQFFPTEFAEIAHRTQEGDLPSWQVEEEQLGLDHGEVGGLLLGRWVLPRSIVDAVTFHHRPEEAPRKHTRIAEITWAAEALCSAAGLDLPHEGVASIRPADVLARLGMPEDEEAIVLDEVCALGERARAMLPFPSYPSEDSTRP